MLVKDVMKRGVVSLDENSKISKAAKAMDQHKIGSVLALRSGKLSGIVTERDIISKVVAIEGDLTKVKVKEVMTSPVIVVSPHMDLGDAVEIMVSKSIRRLPVIEGEELVGILSSEDIIAILPKLKIEVDEEFRRVLDEIMRIKKMQEDERVSHYIG
jgi:CBS domain-containing protein